MTIEQNLSPEEHRALKRLAGDNSVFYVYAWRHRKLGGNDLNTEKNPAIKKNLVGIQPREPIINNNGEFLELGYIGKSEKAMGAGFYREE